MSRANDGMGTSVGNHITGEGDWRRENIFDFQWGLIGGTEAEAEGAAARGTAQGVADGRRGKLDLGGSVRKMGFTGRFWADGNVGRRVALRACSSVG